MNSCRSQQLSTPKKFRPEKLTKLNRKLIFAPSTSFCCVLYLMSFLTFLKFGSALHCSGAERSGPVGTKLVFKIIQLGKM